MIRFENEVCNYLQLPAIPKKEWNGKDSFKKGVAVVRLLVSGLGYAVCSFDNEYDKEPRIIKSFAAEPFFEIQKVFLVPNYMNTSDSDIKDMDLDEESKKKAEEIVKEAMELTKEKTEEDKKVEEMQALPEWVFPEITNAEEARAWLQSYNAKRGVKKGKIPTNEDTLKMRLLNIYSQIKKEK